MHCEQAKDKTRWLLTGQIFDVQVKLFFLSVNFCRLCLKSVFFIVFEMLFADWKQPLLAQPAWTQRPKSL